MNRLARLWLCVLPALAVTSFAADQTVIRGATVFDATRRMPYVADVGIHEGRIVAIGEDLVAEPGSVEIDATGLALLPGFMDVHVHWTAQRQSDTRTETAHALLKHGVTTSSDFHSAPEAYASLRAWAATQVAPHTLYAARMSTPGGHGAGWADINMTRTVTSEYDARLAARTVLSYRPDFIKVFSDGWRYGSGVNLANVNQGALSAIVEEAGHTPVVTHTVSVDKAKIAARAGVTAIVHAIQDRDTDAELIALLVDNGVYYAPTLAVYEPRPDKLIGATDGQLARVNKRQGHSRHNLEAFYGAGVRIALGTDSGIASTPYGESTLREMELLVEFGMSAADALRAGTANSAAVFRVDDDRGTIEIGKRADLVLVRGRPWEDISEVRNIEAVFVNGDLPVSQGDVVADLERSGVGTQLAPRMIDDFEGDERRTSNDALRLHNADTGHPRSGVLSYRVPRSRNNRALHIAAEMSMKESPRAVVYLPLSRGNFFAFDLSAYRGVRFDARGEGDYFMGIHGSSGVAHATFSADRRWRTRRIDFDQLERDETVDAEDSAMAYGVEFGAERQAGETFWLEIDNVEFY